MKKFLTLLLTIVMAISCFAAGCNPSGELNNSEIAEVYRVAAVQTLQKIGVSVPMNNSGGNKPFSVSFPDKMTEATSEYQFKQIKLNAKDSAGIMYLLSLLYSKPEYKTVDGLARFDVTYVLDGTTVTQNMNIKSLLDTDNNKLYFEAMVYTPQFNRPDYEARGYTYAEITYDFDAGLVVDCRFTMEHNGEWRDMKLTAGGQFLWYESEDPTDSFVISANNQMNSFVSEFNAISKLSTDFSNEMMEYLRFSGLVEDQINNGGNNGGNNGDEGGDEGGDDGIKDVVQGGDVEMPDNPGLPANQEVSADVWNQSLNLTQVTKYGLAYETNGERVYYEINGTTIIKWAVDPSTGRESPIFYGVEAGQYVRYTMTKTDVDVDIQKTTISEAEYNEVANKVRIDFATLLPQAQFEYRPEYACYSAGLGLIDGVNYIEVCFYNGQLQCVRYIMNDVYYNINISYDLGEVELPSAK